MPDDPALPSAPLPLTLDLESARDVNVQVPATTRFVELDPKSRAGIRLAQIVLSIIAAFLALSLLGAFLSEWRMAARMDGLYGQLIPGTGAIDTVRVAALQSLVEPIMTQFQAQQAEARRFWMDMVQMILLGALLPVLTALLGYIFGTREAEAES